MARTEGTVQTVGGQVEAASGSIVEIQRIAAPYTTVVNRAQMVDPSKDLLPRFGVERFQIQQIMRVDGEQGPNGEMVWKPVNDKFDQVRFAGGGWTNVADTNGARPFTTTTNDFVEISFYGTGLNILIKDNSSADYRVSVDGAAETTFTQSASASSTLSSKNYAANIVFNIAPNLSLGLHTVKIRLNSVALNLYGFEIVNSGSSIQLPAGSIWNKGKKLTQASLATTAYNSGFESGSLGSTGGRVLIYKKADGSTAKAVQPVAASPSYLSASSHANEELIRTHFFREFGVGRSDDFSTLAGSTTGRTFTLDDGSTTLSSPDMTMPDEFLRTGASGQSFTFTFVGSGFDLQYVDDSGSGSETYTVLIDNVSAGNLSSSASTIERVERIASGLPYGTHIVKITKTTNAAFQRKFRLINVFGPKKPTLPTGAVELADYNIVANYTANATAGVNTIAAGVIRKQNVRELVYSGTWAGYTIDVNNSASGMYIYNAVSGGYVECTFFGTGFEFRGGGNTGKSSNLTVSLQSISTGGSLQTMNITNFPAISGNTSSYGGFSFNASTGALSVAVSNTNGSGFRASGLALGLYKVRITNNVSVEFDANSFDIITPIHVHKNNGPFVLQNTLAVGSQGIGDLRKFGDQLPRVKNSVMSRKIDDQSSITALTPVSGNAAAFYSENGEPILVSTTVAVETGTNGTRHITTVYLNGLGGFGFYDSGINPGSLRAVNSSQSFVIMPQKGWNFIYTMCTPTDGQTINFRAQSGYSFSICEVGE